MQVLTGRPPFVQLSGRAGRGATARQRRPLDDVSNGPRRHPTQVHQHCREAVSRAAA